MSKNAVRQWVFSGVVTCILFVGVAAAETIRRGSPGRQTASKSTTMNAGIRRSRGDR